MHAFAGIDTPIATPFSPDGGIDTTALTRNVAKYLESAHVAS